MKTIQKKFQINNARRIVFIDQDHVDTSRLQRSFENVMKKINLKIKILGGKIFRGGEG